MSLTSFENASTVQTRGLPIFPAFFSTFCDFFSSIGSCSVQDVGSWTATKRDPESSTLYAIPLTGLENQRTTDASNRIG